MKQVDPFALVSKQSVVDALNDFVAIYRRDLSPGAVAAYWHVLKDMQQGDFDYAVRYVLQHERFFPTPAVFFAAVRARRT